MSKLQADQPILASIRLAEVLGALSFALDLTEGQPEGHCVRCCYIGTRIGELVQLSDNQLWELYYTLLLKDLGCSSNAARICQLYLTDDLVAKGDYKTVDGSLPQVLGFIIRHTGVKSDLAGRFRALFNIAANGKQISRELTETRCQTGADIARMLRFPEPVATGIHYLDERWDGEGLPEGLSGTAIPTYSQIALLAQVVDVFNTAEGRAAAMAEVEKRAGTWFNPELVAAFQVAGADDAFWQRLDAPDLPEHVFNLDPARTRADISEDHLDDIAAAFARVVDNKSPFTAGHSERVTVFADLIAAGMGYSDSHRRWLRRAALLHDIGKLGVSNAILDKPGKPDDDEWTQIRMHPVYSRSILERIGPFADLAAIGGSHHERLDGKGYPEGLTGDGISDDVRIVTVADVFDALTADRPYRAALPVGEALAIMRRDAGTAFDPRMLAALEAAVTLSGTDAA